jgi:uncharacterized protein
MNTRLVDKLEHYLSSDQDFQAIYIYTKARFEAATGLYAHNFEHARRDVLNAIMIGEPEAADMHIVLCAAVMHDIGYLYGAARDIHGQVGAEKLADYLAAGKIDLDPAEQTRIAACIRTHKGLVQGIEPETLEARVVADADHLDKYGPIGVYQGTLALSEFGLTASQIIERYKTSRDLPMFTATANKLANDRKLFSKNFEQAFVSAYAPYLATELKEQL